MKTAERGSMKQQRTAALDSNQPQPNMLGPMPELTTREKVVDTAMGPSFNYHHPNQRNKSGIVSIVCNHC